MGGRRVGNGIVVLMAAGLFLSACATEMDSTAGMALPSTTSPAAAAKEALAAGDGVSNEKTAALPAAERAPLSKNAITLEEAVRRAVSWHPSIDEAVGKLNQSTSEIAVARSGYFPKVRGGLNSGYDSNDDDGWQPQLNVSASQMIYDFGKVSSAVDARVAGKEISRADLLLAVDTLIRDTAYAVVEVQRYRALRNVALKQIEGVQAIAELVQKRTDKGASTKSDEVQAAARVEAAKSTLLEIDAALSRWETALASLMGGGGAFTVDAGMPAWLTRACEIAEPNWSQVPAMMRADARRKEAVARLGESRAQALPTVSLEAGAGYNFDGSSNSRYDDDDQPEFTVGVNVSSALYEGGATSARREAAGFALRAADAARDNARFEVTRSLSEASSQIGSISRLRASLTARSGMMATTRDLYRQQYLELGTRSLLDLLNAEQELHAAEFDKVNTAQDIYRLNLDCMFNSGTSRSSFAVGDTTVRGVSLRS